MGCHCLLQGNSRCFYIQNFFFQLNCVMSSLCTTHTHTHTTLRECFFLLSSDEAVSRCVSSAVDSAVSLLCRRFACFQIQQEELLGEDGAHARTLGRGSDLWLWSGARKAGRQELSPVFTPRP